MPGYIDNSSNEALFESYSEGRALSGQVIAHKQMAQWSAVNDDRTCDWCGWADMRIYDYQEEPNDPPVHWGCRCLVAYLHPDEFPPTSDWGKGPPPEAFPPGRTNGANRSGKPVRKSEKKTKKPSRLDARTKKAVDNWKAKLSKRFGAEQERGAGVGKPLRDWLHKELRDATNDPVAVDLYNQFWQNWAGASPRGMKEIANAAAVGDATELARLAALHKDAYGMNLKMAQALSNPEKADKFIKVWQAQKDISVEVTRLSKLAKDGQVTIYRGVKVRPDVDDAFQKVLQSIKGGDLEQALGSNFMESWSTAPGVAHDFAGAEGIVFKKTIPVEDVFNTWQTEGAFSRMVENEITWYNWDQTLVPKATKEVERYFRPGAAKITEVEVW